MLLCMQSAHTGIKPFLITFNCAPRTYIEDFKISKHVKKSLASTLQTLVEKKLNSYFC